MLLITSALNKPRTVMDFQAQGLHVLPVPVNAAIPQPCGAAVSWVPDAAALHRSAAAMKELLGCLPTRAWAGSA